MRGKKRRRESVGSCSLRKPPTLIVAAVNPGEDVAPVGFTNPVIYPPSRSATRVSLGMAVK